MSYLQLATFIQEEELDSDDEVDLSKFMPKSERKAGVSPFCLFSCEDDCYL